jgi:ribosomal protein S18 acetylase RimI-like enzyme
MQLRDATEDDVDAIRAVARESLLASYGHAVDESLLAEAVDEWYDPDDLIADIDDERTVCPVAVVDDDVVGFAESYVVGRRERIGEIDWLHVHPDARGDGIGVELLEHTEAALRERGATRVEGRVLAANTVGNEFYQDHGFSRSGEVELDVGGSTHTEHRYVKLPTDDAELTERRDTEVGPLWVAFDERERGSDAPFYAAYRDEQRTEKYGFYCANCETVDNAMDSMGRIECNVCGNFKKPDEWDSAHE